MNGRESHVLVFNPGSASLKFEVIEACPIEVGDVPLPRDVGVERPTLTVVYPSFRGVKTPLDTNRRPVVLNSRSYRRCRYLQSAILK